MQSEMPKRDPEQKPEARFHSGEPGDRRTALTKEQIEAAFDLLGLKTETDRAAFHKEWFISDDEPPSGRFQVRLGGSSETI